MTESSKVFDRTIVLCSCERTMPVHDRAVERACPGARVETGDQFCGAELDRVRALLGTGGPIAIGCTQEAPLFREVAADSGFSGDLAFVNIRETAGWSSEADRAGPKTAALIAAAAEPLPPVPMVSLSSSGVVLIYGRDERAIEAGARLAADLDVTVLLTRPADIAPPRVREFPVFKGTIRTLSGHLGAFEAVVDDFARPAPSSRSRLVFGSARNGAVSRADIVLDLSGGAPLIAADSLREGYLRADPGNPAAFEAAIARAADLVGEFDKPRYVTFTESLCAHSRSRITGCTRCLSVCPTGAISPAGDHVAIDALICMGCGSCASVCPTGAATYALPPPDAGLRRLRTLVRTYLSAGGRDAVILLHDAEHGAELVDALSRFGDGLPANVLPFAVNEITQFGLESWTAPFAWGAAGVVALTRARPKHDLHALSSVIAAANGILLALGFGDGACRLVQTDDPDELARAFPPDPAIASRHPSAFLPVGEKRGLLQTTLLALHEAAPAPVDRIALPPGAPFGTLDIRVEGCTLCLSCVSACPTGALFDSPDRPTLRFAESACVQCGLCAATCPEKVIALEPRLDFPAWAAGPRLVKEEEPFCCIACGKPFGTKSTIERIIAKLEGKHWMFAGANARRLDAIRMCDTCRIEAVTNEGLDPYAAEPRPRPRTTDDYFAERKAGGAG